MSFAQLAIREAAIKQSLLLAPLLADIPEEIEEDIQLPVATQPEPVRTAIYSPCTNQLIQTTSVDTSILLPGDDFQITAVTNGNITSTYIREISANRWYAVQSSATAPTTARTLQIITETNGTNITRLVPYQTATSSTTGIIYDGTSTWTTTSANLIYTNTYLTQIACPDGEYKPRRRDFGIKKVVKNSIKRALKLFDNFGMEEDAKIFLNGKDIEVSHPESLFKFVLTKEKYHSVKSGIEYPIHSTPFKLSLFTKSNIHIADLCVYAENTPMLDNLMMIAMYVKTGNEEDLLRMANYSRLCKDVETKEILALEYPYLQSKLLRN